MPYLLKGIRFIDRRASARNYGFLPADPHYRYALPDLYCISIMFVIRLG